jgi:hypothetical protein
MKLPVWTVNIPIVLFVVVVLWLLYIIQVAKTGDIKVNLCRSRIAQTKITCEAFGCYWVKAMGFENTPPYTCALQRGTP